MTRARRDHCRRSTATVQIDGAIFQSFSTGHPDWMGRADHPRVRRLSHRCALDQFTTFNIYSRLPPRILFAATELCGASEVVVERGASLAPFEHKVSDHPDFESFASGVMASPFAPRHISGNGNLMLRFWPCVLRGSSPGRIWSPPAEPMNSPAQRERISRWPSPSSRACRRLVREHPVAANNSSAFAQRASCRDEMQPLLALLLSGPQANGCCFGPPSRTSLLILWISAV
jgi:hypothetical protein